MDSQVGERIRPDLIVYVRCNDLDLLQRRIKRRARSEEANIDPKFLQQVIEIGRSVWQINTGVAKRVLPRFGEFFVTAIA